MRFICKLIVSGLCLVSMLTVLSVLAHQSGFNQIPSVACENKSLNDACQFYNSKQDVYRGSCRSISDVLMCVRNQPIEYATENSQQTEGGDHHSGQQLMEDKHSD